MTNEEWLTHGCKICKKCKAWDIIKNHINICDFVESYATEVAIKFCYEKIDYKTLVFLVRKIKNKEKISIHDIEYYMDRKVIKTKYEKEFIERWSATILFFWDKLPEDLRKDL